MKWRKWNNIIHRDLGYLCFGLTIIYAISGVAVNHIDDWNPNYQIEIIETTIDPITTDFESKDELAQEVLKRLNIQETYKNTFLPNPQTIDIFLEEQTISADYRTGNVQTEIVKNRPILREFNFLHLNAPKKLWTIIADLYAISLAILAITGLFVLKGKNGIKGRGAWLSIIGIIIPIVFFWLYFYI